MKKLKIGDTVKIKERPYHWRGNGQTGVITEILSGGAPNVEVTFEDNTFDLFNARDLALAAHAGEEGQP